MFLFVFSTGQSTGMGWLDSCIDAEVEGIFDGDGCLAGMIPSSCSGGCGDCMSCSDCSDCGSCGCDGCVIEKIPGTYGDRPAVQDVTQIRLTSRGITFFEGMLGPMLGSRLEPLTQNLISGSARDIAANLQVVDYADKVFCDSSRAKSCGVQLRLENLKLSPMAPVQGQADRLQLSMDIFAKLTSTDLNGTVHDGWLSREKRTVRTVVRYCNEDPGWPCNTDCGWDLACQAAKLLCTDCDRDCTLNYDTEKGGQSHIGFSVLFELGMSGVSPRADINVISMLPMTGPTGELSGVELGDDLWGCGLEGLVDNNIGEYVVYRVTEELSNRIPSLVKTMLCEHPGNILDENGLQPLTVEGDPGACPAGNSLHSYSFGMDGILPPVQRCGQDATACLPILLGMERRVDFGGLLGSVIPGFNAVVDFLVAAAGGATTPEQGLSVWLKGGLDAPTGHSDCVPVLSPEEHPFPDSLEPGQPPYFVPRAKLFEGNTHPTSPRSPDIMVGVSEQFVNYAAYQLWDAGALCIQVGSTTIPMLSPSLLGIALGTSLNTLVFPADSKKSPLGLALRPQKPPVVRFEELASPGIRVNAQLPQLAIDFYAWSLDRYVRLVTIELDVTASVDVKVNDGKVGIYLGGIAFENAEAKNASLVSNPASIVNFFGAGIGGIISSVLGSSDAPLFELDLGDMIPSHFCLGGSYDKKSGTCKDREGADIPDAAPIPLPMGVELREDAFGVVHVDEAGNTVGSRDEAHDTFMGIFVDFFLSDEAPASGLEGAIQTHVEVTSVYIPEDRTAFQPETLGQGELPRVEIYMSADAPEGVPLEYRYRLALGGWSEWQDSPYAVIESPALALQQEHLIMARARVKGDPRSEDKSSAIAKARIDVTPPLIDLADDGKKVRLQAVDFVSPMSNLQYRYREPGGEFSEWQSFGDASVALLDASQEVEVEVRDEAGNIASNVAELRGLPQAEPGGGCSCTVAGKPTNSGSTLGFLAMLAVLGGTFYRVRRRRSA